MSRTPPELNEHGFTREEWDALPWRLHREFQYARAPRDRNTAWSEARAILDAYARREPLPLPMGLKPLLFYPKTRDPKPDVIPCECGAMVSWAVYVDHHGSRVREPDPTEDTTDPVECECGQIVLGAGWLPFHRGGRCHKDRMARKAAIARAFVVRPIDWCWCACGAQVRVEDIEGHRARMHVEEVELRRAA